MLALSAGTLMASASTPHWLVQAHFYSCLSHNIKVEAYEQLLACHNTVSNDPEAGQAKCQPCFVFAVTGQDNNEGNAHFAST